MLYEEFKQELYKNEVIKEIIENDLYNKNSSDTLNKSEFINFLLKLKDSNVILNNLKENPEQIYNHYVQFKILELKHEVEDFKNQNRFLNIAQEYLDNLKNYPEKDDSRNITKNILINLIAQQTHQCYNLAKKFSDLNIKLRETLVIKCAHLNNLKHRLKKDNIELNKLYFKKQRLSLLEKVNLKFNKDYRTIKNKFNDIKCKNKECNNLIIETENFIKNIDSVDLYNQFLINPNYNEKWKIINILESDSEFIKSCKLFDSQKIKLHSLSNYQKDLSELFNNAIGDKADLIMDSVLSHLEDMLLTTQKEKTIPTKISKVLCGLNENLRIPSIEGKDVYSVLKDKSLNYTGKKLLMTAGATICLAIAGCIPGVELAQNYKSQNTVDVNRLIFSMQKFDSNNEIDVEGTINNISMLTQDQLNSLCIEDNTKKSLSQKVQLKRTTKDISFDEIN